MDSNFEHSPDIPSGTDGGCSWVKTHLGAYDLWDDSLSLAEFEAIETHLHRCPLCALEYEEIREGREAIEMAAAGMGCDAWNQAKKDYAAHTLTCLRDSGLFADDIPATLGGAEGGTGVSPVISSARSTCNPSEPVVTVPRTGDLSRREYEASTVWRTGWKRPAAIAASLLFMLALPVLAVVGVQQYFANANAPEENPKSLVADKSFPAQFDTAQQQNIPVASPTVPTSDSARYASASLSDASLDAMLEATTLQLELAALLPDTEEEYEIWARKEYPHIMALYDILTQVDENDPASLPLWDGIPVNTPEWVERLYEDIPQNERPTNWRALIIYSGEIFKFDWPGELDAPNCRPTLQALQQAAAASGFLLQFSEGGEYNVPNLSYADDEGGEIRFAPGTIEAGTLMWALPTHRVLEDYIAIMREDASLAQASLRYLATSSHIVGVSIFDEISQRANRLIADFIELGGRACDPGARLLLFEELLNNRGELIDQCVMRINQVDHHPLLENGRAGIGLRDSLKKKGALESTLRLISCRTTEAKSLKKGRTE